MGLLNKAMNEGTNSEGGYLVPEEWAKKLFDEIREKSKLLPLVESVNMATDVWFAPTIISGTTTYWVPELGLITESDMGTGQLTLTAKKIAAKVPISTEIEEDALNDVMGMVSSRMSDDIAYSLDLEILTGTGGQFTSNWYSAHGNEVNASGASGDDLTVEKFNQAIYAGAADNMNYDYVVCHPRVVRDLRSLTDGNARPLMDVASYGSPLIKDGVVGTIMGLKIIEHTGVSITESKGSASDLTWIYVVQSKRCGLFGKRRSITAHKFYDIDYDKWVLQVNMRCAFTVPYANAVCAIKDITA